MLLRAETTWRSFGDFRLKRFYFTGHRTFENRGCEAIVRSTVMMLNDVIGPCEILVPSDDIARDSRQRSEEHTSELQSLMRISYAVFCLKKKKYKKLTHTMKK